jgi:tRNA(Ser,Leu) C12 N-acetylase TAN1
MVKPGVTDVPYEMAESLLVPGCPGNVFVALRPDDNTANVRLLAEGTPRSSRPIKRGAEPRRPPPPRIRPHHSPFVGRHPGLIEEADKVGAAGWTKTEHTQRLIPIERIAPEANLDELAAKIIAEHFPPVAPLDRPAALPSFRVHYEEHSPAMHLHKMDVEKKIADLVPKESYRVDLENPDRVILVVVAGGSAMLSVVREYEAKQKYHHFHIHSKADLPKGTAKGGEEQNVKVLSSA